MKQHFPQFETPYLPASRLVVRGGDQGVSMTNSYTMAIVRRFLEELRAPLPSRCKDDVEPVPRVVS
ncbi:MAG: hypothetical protein AB8G77_09670 [Rhodothermales bacterium]